MSAWQRLNPQLLQYFLAVSRTGSLTAAAQQLHCVPSNVSARLRQLESQLDVPLFQRTRRQLALTSAGERLLPYATQLEQLCQQAWSSVQEDLWSGALRLGAMETCAAMRLPEILASFHQRAPRVSLTLLTGHSSWLIDEVLAGRLDAALIGGPYSHPLLSTETLWHEQLQLALPAGATVDMLQAKPLVLLGFPAGCHYKDRLDRWAAQQGIEVRSRQSYGSLEAILGGIAAGMGAGLLPRSLLQHHPRASLVSWHPIDPELAHTPTVLIRRHDALMHAALEPLLELMRDSVLQEC